MRYPLCCLLVVAGCGSANHPTRATPAAAEEPATLLTDDQRARDEALAGRAAAFIDAYANMNPLLLRDGRVVFVSTRGAMPALYISDRQHPDMPPRKLPGPDDRITGAVVLPDEHTALVLADHEGDENYHIVRVELDGSSFTDLTPAPVMHRNVPTTAADVPDLFAYSAHTIADASAHLFVQRLNGPPREFYVDKVSGFLAGLSPDGARALYVRTVSDESTVLFVIDTAPGKATRVAPGEHEMAAISNPTFNRDGRAIYLTSEAHGRAAQALRLDASSLRETARYVETKAPTALVQTLAVAPSGNAVALGLDLGDHFELRVTDADLANVRTVPLGLTSGWANDFSNDGKRLGLTLNPLDRPTDVFELDVSTLTAAPLRHEPRSGLGAPLMGAIEHVRAFDGLSIPINVYLPTELRDRKLPTLVLVHGGPSGSAQFGWGSTAAFWTAMGFAVVAPNIRGSSGFGFDFMAADNGAKRGDALRDMESVNGWVRSQPWCDPGKIVIGGISYGGYMTLLALGKQPALWSAGIDGSGMSNLKTMEELEDQTIRVYDETEFGKLGRDDDLLVRWSPLTYADSIASPLFIYQGINDPVTPRGEADQIVRALRRRHIPIEYMLITNEGHGVTRRDNRIAYLVRSYRFLAEHLGLDSTRAAR